MRSASARRPRTRKRCVNSKFLAEIFGVHQNTIVRWANSGRLPAPTGVGTHRRWLYEVIERFAAEHGISMPSEEVPQ
jgi:hypothetical protein